MWQALLAAQTSHSRCAHVLGVGEAQLLATDCTGRVTRLEGDWPQLITEFPRRLHSVQPCTSVTESFGKLNFSPDGASGGADIDLRLFMLLSGHGVSP